MLLSRAARTRLSGPFRSQLRRRYASKSSFPGSNTAGFLSGIVFGSAATGAGIWWLKKTDLPSPTHSSTKQSPVGPGGLRDGVTQKLSQNAYSVPVQDVVGVNRYDVAQVASNSPCEDRFIHDTIALPGIHAKPWMAWAVFDGHAGWQTADFLEKQLLSSVQQKLGIVDPNSSMNLDSTEQVNGAIVKAFVDLDDAIMKTAPQTCQSDLTLAEKVQRLSPALAGSCALLSLYDPTSSRLHVACTGDSRAVLGQQDSEGKWHAVPLSIDQTGSNEEEISRINQEHPGEEGIAKDGRILGIMVSRAFGDGRWKWPLDFQTEVKDRFHGQAPLTPKYNIQTPPYLTAEPVVTTTAIDPTKPTFLILASDGLWDNLSNQQAVDLVGKWLEPSKAETGPRPAYPPFDFSQLSKGVSAKFEEERTTRKDDNAAVHLIRNSLGGNHRELLEGRLAVGTPLSRDVRDDITVQVVFFGVPGLESPRH